MGAPGQDIDRQNHQQYPYQVRIESTFISQNKQGALENTKTRYPQKRAQRAPLGKEDKQHQTPKAKKSNGQPANPIAA